MRPAALSARPRKSPERDRASDPSQENPGRAIERESGSVSLSISPGESTRGGKRSAPPLATGGSRGPPLHDPPEPCSRPQPRNPAPPVPQSTPPPPSLQPPHPKAPSPQPDHDSATACSSPPRTPQTRRPHPSISSAPDPAPCPALSPFSVLVPVQYSSPALASRGKAAAPLAAQRAAASPHRSPPGERRRQSRAPPCTRTPQTALTAPTPIPVPWPQRPVSEGFCTYRTLVKNTQNPGSARTESPQAPCRNSQIDPHGLHADSSPLRHRPQPSHIDLASLQTRIPAAAPLGCSTPPGSSHNSSLLAAPSPLKPSPTAQTTTPQSATLQAMTRPQPLDSRSVIFQSEHRRG